MMYLKKELYELIKKDDSLFDFIQEGSLDGLWYWDLVNPENEWMNARFWTVLGYLPEEMPHKSSAWQDIINQDDLQVALENFRKHCENPDFPYDQEVRYKHKDGSTKWIRCRGIVLRDDQGKPVRMLGAHQDITELKKSEQIQIELKKTAEISEEKYRALYDSAPLSYQSLDENGCFLDVNPRWLTTLGYKKEEVIGHWFGDFLHPEYVEHFRKNFPAFKKRGYVSDVQFQLRKKDNSYIYVSFEGCIGYTAEGKFRQTYCVFKDITEQKALEDELIHARQKAEESEKLFRSLIENAADGVVIINEHGAIQYVSPNAARLFGYTADELTGTPGNKYTHPEDLPKVLQVFQTILDNPQEKLKLEYRFKHKSGEFRWIETTFTNLLADKAIKGFVLNFSDITERKRVFEALHREKTKAEESEARFRNAIENSPIPMAVVGIDEVTLFLNKQFIETYGYDINDIPGIKNWYERAYPDPDYRKATIEDWNKAVEQSIKNKLPTEVREYQVTCKNGDVKTVAVSAYFERETIVGLFQDITERKMTEAALKQIEWMLKDKKEKYDALTPEYGDLTSLNENGLILTSVGRDQLINIASEYLDLLETSSAVYEKNGDYAMGIFSSNWCRMMDTASRKLCLTPTNSEALECGLWHCHESCWRKASMVAIESGEPVDIACNGGIRLYAIPIRANGEVIGAINFGYGEPPKTEDELKSLADLYQIPVHELRAARNEYKVRPQFIIDLAKKRLQVSAQFIGHLIERRQVEDALRNSEERYELAIGASEQGIWDWNVETNEVFYSKQWKRQIGYEDHEIENVFDSWTDHLHPDEKQACQLAVQNYLNNPEGHFLLEFRFRHKDGSYRWIYNKAASLLNDEGKVVRMFGSHLDITDRKEAEQLLQEKNQEIAAQNEEMAVQNEELSLVNIKLHEAKQKAETSEERFNLAMQASTDGIFDWNLETNDIYYSPAWKKMLGYKEHEIPNDFSVWETTTHPEDVKKSWELQQKLIAKQIDRFVIEFKMKHKDGHWVDILSQAEAVFNASGKAVRIVGTHSDISERKKAERALKDSEQRFRSLVNTLNSGVAFYKVINDGKSGNDYIIQSFNDFALKHEHLNEKEVIGKSLKDIRPEIDNYGLIDIFREVWQTGNSALYPAKLYVDDNYANFYENRVFRISTGEIVAVYDDVTERENAYLALKNALEKAQESDRLKSAFLANMSHEIRTPMNGILGFADLLKKPDLTGEQQKKYISIIEKSGVRMLNIINDIVDISKIEAGQMELNIGETNVNEQIDYTYAFFKPEAEARGIQLSLSKCLPDGEVSIQTDREKVYAVLINLVKNALKYTKEGSIELGYVLEGFDSSPEIKFYVKDTGIGIPMERLSAIFERFIQADIDDKMARQGAGLGLAISKAYVEMLGGKIWVESNSDEQLGSIGSTFYFTLPYKCRTKSSAENLNPSVHNPVAPVKKLNVLIAEDDEVSEMLIENYISEFAKKIVKARTGVEAVDVCKNNPDIDLVLMDIRMPEMGGLEATKRIRDFNSGVVIIAQTAYGLVGDRETAINAGCNDYISKPIDCHQFNLLIKKYFGKD